MIGAQFLDDLLVKIAWNQDDPPLIEIVNDVKAVYALEDDDLFKLDLLHGNLVSLIWNRLLILSDRRPGFRIAAVEPWAKLIMRVTLMRNNPTPKQRALRLFV